MTPAGTQGSPSSPQDPSRRISFPSAWWLVPIVLIAAAVAAAWGLPRLVGRAGAGEIDRLARRLGGTVDHGEVCLAGLTRVAVDRIAWREGSDFEAVIEGVGIEVDPIAALVGGRAVRRVEAARVSVRLGDPGAPAQDPAALVARLRRLVKPRGAEASGGTGSRPRALPDLEVADLQGTVTALGRTAEIRGGSVRLAVPDGEMDPLARSLEARLVGTLGDDAVREARIEARLAGTRPEEARLTVTPPVSAVLERGTVDAVGVAWKQGEASILSPRLARKNGTALGADAITVRWDPEGDGSAAIAGLPDDLPEAIRDFLSRHPLREIELTRPVLEVALIAPADAAGREASGDGDGAADGTLLEGDDEAQKEGAFRRVVTRSFGLAAGRLDRATGTLKRLLARMPAARLTVHGATVRYTGEASGSGLANLDAALWREKTDGPVEGRVSFETPEARAGTNEARFTADPARATVQASIKARWLPLSPYRGLLPRWVRTDAAMALRDTDLTVTFGGDARTVTLQGTLAVTGLGLDLPAVASTPLKGLDLAASGTLDGDWGAGSVEVRGASLSLRSLKVPFEMKATRLADAPHVTLQASVERVRAQDLVESIPAEAVPALEGLELAGSFAATFRLDVNATDLGAMVFDFKPDVNDLTTVALGKGVNLDLLRHEFLHRIEEGGGKVVDRRIGETSADWVPLASVPRYLVDALTTGEDASFFSHHGFSLAGIRRSLQVNLERGGFYQGASTLSQQLVKNLFLSREKTLARKLQEVFITWQLERFLSKEKILELYLNVIEWGPQVWGLREAAMHYFGKKPEELGLLESAYLVSIIPNPRLFHKHYDAGQVPAAFEARVKGLIREMAKRHLVSEDAAAGAIEAHVRFVLAPREADAPPPDEEFSD